MKIICFLLFIVFENMIGLDSDQSSGPHGGVVKWAEGYYIEMKSQDKFIYVYLLDNKFKTLENREVSGEVIFFLSNNTTLDVKLKPYMENMFMAEAADGFYSCRITLHKAGAYLSAIFENQSQIVQEQ